MCSLSHPNATCKFVGGKLKHVDLCKKKKKNKSNDKWYLQMLHLILFFHRRSTAIPFRMKIGKHACYTNMNIYKKKSEFLKFIYYLFLIYCSPPRAKTLRPAALPYSH